MMRSAKPPGPSYRRTALLSPKDSQSPRSSIGTWLTRTRTQRSTLTSLRQAVQPVGSRPRAKPIDELTGRLCALATVAAQVLDFWYYVTVLRHHTSLRETDS